MIIYSLVYLDITNYLVKHFSRISDHSPCDIDIIKISSLQEIHDV